jgi:YbbR domain-containing protein
MSHVSTENIRAVVDVSGLGVGEYSLDVHAEASQDAGVVRISPATVRVRIDSVKP